MPYFFYYILKVTVCSALLFGYYHLCLRNKVYHAYNRFYLLSATLLSLAIPLLNFEYIFNGDASSKSIQLLQVVNSGNQYLEEIFINGNAAGISRNEWLLLGYSLLSTFLLLALIRAWINIYRLIKRHQAQSLSDVLFIPSKEKGTPFSFFQYIFWNSDIDINTTTGRQIFAHELAHVREKHSFDKLYMNCLLIVFWINPVFWLIKKELNLIHEFIADKKAIADNDAGALAAMIVQSAYPQHSFMLSNHFFHSPIKRRLKMLTKYSSTKAGYLYRVLALPVILFLVALLTIKAKSGITELVNPDEQITVLIDAGHGGQDAGATGADKKTTEKEINLALLNKIRSMNNLDNIKLVFTRTDDVYQTPLEKVDIARGAKADLCISIHVAAKQGAVTSASGLEVYISKTNTDVKSNLIASAVIQEFKENYALPVASNPVQSSIGIALLDRVTCPSIIIEAGYMNNPGDLNYLQSDAAQTQFAKNVLSAISNYANNKDKAVVEVLAPIMQDTVPDLGTYQGQKINNIRVREKTKMVELELANGKKVSMSMAQAEKEGIVPPPPPPPLPPAPGAPLPPAPPPPPPPALALTRTALDSLQQDLRYVDASQKLERTMDLNAQKKALVELSKANAAQEIALKEQRAILNGDPLYILEGKEVRALEVKKLNAEAIESINILKGESAIEKYGKEKAMNGVIEVQLKQNIENIEKLKLTEAKLEAQKQKLKLQEVKVKDQQKKRQ